MLKENQNIHLTRKLINLLMRHLRVKPFSLFSSFSSFSSLIKRHFLGLTHQAKAKAKAKVDVSVVVHAALALAFVSVTLLPTVSLAQENTVSTQAEAPIVSSDVLISPQPVKFRIAQLNNNLTDLLEEHITIFSSSAEPQALTPALMRKIEEDIDSILATEGYFTPTIQLEKKDNNIVVVNVNAGLQTTIKEVNIHIAGALNDDANAGQVDAYNRRADLIQSWSLKAGDAFRNSDWSTAKTALMEAIRSELYVDAKLIDSTASVDADNHSAVLELDIDTGPAYQFGDLQVQGLDRYPLWLLDRFEPPHKGDPYSKERLLKFQNALQNSAYFSSVIFNAESDPSSELDEVIDPALEPKSETTTVPKSETAKTKESAIAVLPIKIDLIERQTRDLGISAGYSSSTGFRSEITYRDRNVFNQVWDLRSALRIEQKRQLFYTDVYLPPTEKHKLDSFGVLADRLDVSGLVQTRTAFGVKRTTTLGLLEQRLGANYTQEKVFEKSNDDTQLVYQKRSRALVGTVGWTWRAVDDIINPKSGHRIQLDLAFSEKKIISDQSFLSIYGKYQYWIPFSSKDSVLLRTEFGQIVSNSSDGIPENFLFRTGGSTSVRGYAYQSLGVKQGGAVVGGRVMATASVEYVRWIDPSLGAAVFFDMGDAAKNWKEYKAKQGIGLGARIQTPAGPIAVDLSYGLNSKKIRLDFSIAIAF